MKKFKNILKIIIYSIPLYFIILIGLLYIMHNQNIYPDLNKGRIFILFMYIEFFVYVIPYILYLLADVTGFLRFLKKKKIKLIRYIRKSNKASKIGNIIYITIFSMLFTVSILFLFLISGIAFMFWNPFQYTYIPDLIELILIIIFAILLFYPVFAVFLLIYMFIKNRCKNKQVKLNL